MLNVEGVGPNQRCLHVWAQAKDLCKSRPEPGTSVRTGLSQLPQCKQAQAREFQGEGLYNTRHCRSNARDYLVTLGTPDLQGDWNVAPTAS